MQRSQRNAKLAMMKCPPEIWRMIGGYLDLRDEVHLSMTCRDLKIQSYDDRYKRYLLYHRAVQEDLKFSSTNHFDALFRWAVRGNTADHMIAAKKYLSEGGSVTNQTDVIPAVVVPGARRWPRQLDDYNPKTVDANGEKFEATEFLNYAKTCFHALEVSGMSGQDRLEWVDLLLGNAKEVEYRNGYDATFWSCYHFMFNHLTPDLFCPTTTPALFRLLMEKTCLRTIPIHFSHSHQGSTDSEFGPEQIAQIAKSLYDALVGHVRTYFTADEIEEFAESWEDCLSHLDDVVEEGNKNWSRLPIHLRGIQRRNYLYASQAYQKRSSQTVGGEPLFDVFEHCVGEDNRLSHAAAAARLGFLFACMHPDPEPTEPDVIYVLRKARKFARN